MDYEVGDTVYEFPDDLSQQEVITILRQQGILPGIPARPAPPTPEPIPAIPPAAELAQAREQAAQAAAVQELEARQQRYFRQPAPSLDGHAGQRAPRGHGADARATHSGRGGAMCSASSDRGGRLLWRGSGAGRYQLQVVAHAFGKVRSSGHPGDVAEQDTAGMQWLAVHRVTSRPSGAGARQVAHECCY